MNEGDEFRGPKERQLRSHSVPEGGARNVRPDSHMGDGSSITTFSNPSHVEGPVNIRPYVVEIDQLINQFRAGELSRYKLVSSIIRFLNEDRDISPQERTQSFDLFMAEVDSIKAPSRNTGKRRDSGGPATAVEQLSGAAAVDEPDPGDEGSSGGESSSSSDSGDERPRKKRKLRSSDMLWNKRGKVQAISQNPSCSKSSVVIPLDVLAHERAVALSNPVDLTHSTQQSYGSALNSWIAFTKMHHFPFEPSIDSLSFFIVYMSHYISARTVNSYLSGLVQQLEPDFPNIRDIRSDPLVSKVMKGCLRMEAKAANRK